MRNILHILALAAAVLGAVACDKQIKEVDDPNASVSVNPTTLNFTAEESTATITVNASGTWRARCPERWVVVEPAGGIAKEAVLTVKVDENPSQQPREATITINCYSKTTTVTVVQAGMIPPPDYSGTWTVIGTIDGSNWDKDFEMAENGELVWETTIPYHTGDVFKFRMNAENTMNMGLDGDLTAVDDNNYWAVVKEGGDNITLPAEGFWFVSLDLNALKLSASFVSEFPPEEPDPLPAEWVPVWENDGSHGVVSWSGDYRFALEGHDFNSECIAEIPADVWNQLMTDTFYLYVEATNPNIRITNGWWDVNWKVGDIQPGNELLADNHGGTFIVTINLADDPDFVATLEEKHLLITGDAFTPKGIYFIPKAEPKNPLEGMVPVWENAGAGAISWSSNYRFGLEGHDANNECMTTFPQDIWDKITTGKFCLVYEGADPDIRIVNGWWDAQWGADIYAGDQRITAIGDGKYVLEIQFDDPDFVATLEQKHLLFTGDRYTPVAIYVPDGQASGPVILWDEEAVFDSWSATIVIPAAKFADAKEGDVIRVYYKDKTADFNPIFKHVDDWSDWAELQNAKVVEDAYFESAIPAEALAELKEKGLRFQGVGFTITKVVLL